MPDQQIQNEYGDEHDFEGEREELLEEYKESPEDKIKSIIQEIIEIYNESGQTPWADPEFPADDTSLYIDPLNPPDYSENCQNVLWLRPQEIYTG